MPVGAPLAYGRLGARFLAGVIDSALLLAISIVVQRLGGGAVRAPGLPLVAWSAAYFILAHGPVGNGYSLGKRMCGIRVVSRDGTALSLGASAVRWSVAIGITLPMASLVAGFEREAPLSVLRAMLVAEPVLCVVAVDSLLLLVNRPSRQSLHDLIAGSYVVARTQRGPLPRLSLPRAYLVLLVSCCALVVTFAPRWYRYALELAPRAIELTRASERIRAAHRLGKLLAIPGFTARGSDTVRYVSVLATFDATPHTEREAEALRLALACALASEAPKALRGAELDAMISFNRGSVPTVASTAYVADSDLSVQACARARTPF